MKATFFTVAVVILATTVNAQGTFNPTAFPPVNVVPPVDSPEMKEWLKGLNFADVPVHKLNTGNPPACPALAAIPVDQCWWTCQTCPADDIETCPTPGTWGLTFDDGPTAETPALLQILKASNLKASFFVMGSNVVRNAEVLKQEVADGHHLASHTWSHHPLTTLTNEQIVAELKWTEKAVFDITGLRMKYMRPPYGDIDNRVRAVVKKLGYIVVDWTSDAYDSKDFNLNAGHTNATLAAAVTKMSTTLINYAANPGPKGVITLQHDLYPVTIQFAKLLLPAVAQTNLKAMSVAECLNDASPYQNSPNQNTTSPKPTGPPGTGNSPKVVDGNGANGLSAATGTVFASMALVGVILSIL
ncbi:chitin deacetylase [Mortierella sp. AM989]|nr:chitin deacetylase [Mortierella sp. AM989]